MTRSFISKLKLLIVNFHMNSLSLALQALLISLRVCDILLEPIHLPFHVVFETAELVLIFPVSLGLLIVVLLHHELCLL